MYLCVPGHVDSLNAVWSGGNWLPHGPKEASLKSMVQCFSDSKMHL